MHMADALLTPAVGGAMWAATATTTIYCSAKIRHSLDDHKIPLMGVLGAFVFAAQMINFAIPATGSSGHLGGGLLLAIILGPRAAFLTIASVLTVQALFFADGGLLALGCNIFNLGFFPSFIAYPLIFKKIAGSDPTPGRLLGGSLIAAIVGLQLGSLGVVLQTTLSGISELPFSSFIILMQPIHLVIGIIEGMVTAGVISFVWRARPEILNMTATGHPLGALPIRKTLTILALATVFTGGFISWIASENPDALEWSVMQITGEERLETPATSTHRTLEKVQETTALLPGYEFQEGDGKNDRLGISLAGLVGGLLVMLLGVMIGLLLKKRGVAGNAWLHNDN